MHNCQFILRLSNWVEIAITEKDLVLGDKSRDKLTYLFVRKGLATHLFACFGDAIKDLVFMDPVVLQYCSRKDLAKLLATTKEQKGEQKVKIGNPTHMLCLSTYASSTGGAAGGFLAGPVGSLFGFALGSPTRLFTAVG